MAIERISNRQLAFIVFVMRTTLVISFLPVLTSADTLQDAWASAILSFGGTALILLLITGLATKFPTMTVIEYSQKLLGTWLGGVVSIVYLWAFFWVAAVNVRQYAEVLITGFLTETPLSFIIGAMVLVCAVAAYCGIEVIGRTADFFVPLFMVAILLTLAVLVPKASWGNLEPVLARGIGPVVRGSITPIAEAVQFLPLTFLIPTLKKPRQAIRSAFLGLIPASIILVLTAVLVVTTIGPYLGHHAHFPLFKAIRAIEVTDFLARAEILTIFAWGFGLFIGLSIYIYCGAKGLQQLLGLSTYRPLVLPMAAQWVTLAFHAFDNVFEIHRYHRPEITGPYELSLVLLPTLILWLGYFLAKSRGKLPPAESGDKG